MTSLSLYLSLLLLGGSSAVIFLQPLLPPTMMLLQAETSNQTQIQMLPTSSISCRGVPPMKVNAHRRSFTKGGVLTVGNTFFKPEFFQKPRSKTTPKSTSPLKPWVDFMMDVGPSLPQLTYESRVGGLDHKADRIQATE
ncbi:hypothetical protein MLD38_007101 [Melastoma candidum]|uniref:Uncharacterized protein n=1 Tax=Melastoma candidum TaxID=119954 RepID=A0ACB9RRD8_9MYRT|nr:hypothetical protein MLD38_007101 [Melastoma candidum]